jgi:hypothetical protein
MKGGGYLTIEQIKLDIDQVKKVLFFDSLYKLEVEELKLLFEKVKRLKEDFLEASFIGCMIEELEEIRFELAEISIEIKICIGEELQQNVSADIRKLEELYKTA